MIQNLAKAVWLCLEHLDLPDLQGHPDQLANPDLMVIKDPLVNLDSLVLLDLLDNPDLLDLLVHQEKMENPVDLEDLENVE